MARNKSEALPRVIHKKVWMPLDEHKKTKHAKQFPPRNEWEDKGGSWAFVVQYTPNSNHRKYEVWTQCHRGYKDKFSIRGFGCLEDAMKFWALLDEGPQFRELPKPPYRRPELHSRNGKTVYKHIYADADEPQWPIVVSGEWDGFFPNGSHGHHDGPRSKGGY